MSKHLQKRESEFLDANEMLANLRKSKYAWAVYIPIAVLLNVASTLSGSCLASVMVGIGTFGVPFLLGAKSLGTLLKMGTLILIVSGLVFGALYTYFLYEQVFVFEERELKGTDLEGGAVSPYLGDEDTIYNFTVTYTGTENPDNITVFANITELGSLDESSLPLMNSGNIFYNETTLTANVHMYYFSWHSNTTGGWNRTEGFGIGPVAAPYSDMLMLQMFQGMIIMFIPGGLFFYMIVMLYNSRKKAQAEQKKLLEEEKGWTSKDGEEKEGEEKEGEAGEEEEKEGEEKEGEKEEETVEVIGEFECTECGADVPGDADVCPSCGESFEEEEEKKEEPEKKEESPDEFECTECGADVPGDADVCPSCGESFDDEEETEPNEPAGTYMCTQCGADVPEGAHACPSCGESFDGEEKKEE